MGGEGKACEAKDGWRRQGVGSSELSEGWVVKTRQSFLVYFALKEDTAKASVGGS